MQPSELNRQLYEAEKHQLELVIKSVQDAEFIKAAQAGPAFHDLLVFCQDRGWVHYSELADAVGLSHSQVHRWFKPSGDEHADKRSTPNKFTIAAAMTELQALLQKQLVAVEARICGLSEKIRELDVA